MCLGCPRRTRAGPCWGLCLLAVACVRHLRQCSLARLPALVAVGCPVWNGPATYPILGAPFFFWGGGGGDEMASRAAAGWQDARVHVGDMARAWGHGVAETAKAEACPPSEAFWLWV